MREKAGVATYFMYARYGYVLLFRIKLQRPERAAPQGEMQLTTVAMSLSIPVRLNGMYARSKGWSPMPERKRGFSSYVALQLMPS
jgi:hypothetical protein